MAFDSVDVPLLGHLVVDDTHDASGLPAQLRIADDGIYLEVVIDPSSDPESKYLRWFSPGGHFSDDPDGNRFSYEPPAVLGHRSSKGLVDLLGCRQDWG